MTNTFPSIKVEVFRNVFGIIVDTSDYNSKPPPPYYYPLTFAGVQRWIQEHYSIHVSKSSISIVKTKCGVGKLGYKAGKESDGKSVRSNAEKLVLGAFRALGII